MLTRRGWAAALIASVLVVAGRVLGAVELYVLGTTVGVLLLAGLAYLRLVHIDVDVARELHPPRVHAGSPSRVELRVRNDGTRRSPVLSLRDSVSGTHGARLLVAPLAPGAVARSAYRLPTERRGVLSIGPLEVILSDPLGLASLSMTASGVSELTVYPHVDDVVPVRQTTGNDPMAGAEHPNALGRGGEDFYALRQYVMGDDLRRVHWPSTARHDELMVRQDELPWQGRTTVLLDLRDTATSPESLELVISAGASIVSASARRQDLVRLVGTDGSDSGFAAGHAHFEAILEYLASVQATTGSDLNRVVDRLARSATGGALVVVVAEIRREELDQVLRLRNRFASLTVVSFGRSSVPTGPVATGPLMAPVPAPAGTVTVDADHPFAETWNAAIRPAGGRGPRWEARRPLPDREPTEPDPWRSHSRILR